MFSRGHKKNKSKHTEIIEEAYDNTLSSKLHSVPHHVAIIMDGNGRWAQERKLPRIAGHKEGMNNVKRITECANGLGIKVLTLYAFSTENWKRPSKEVNFLMQLPVDFFDTFVPELIRQNVKVQVMGFTDQLPKHTQKAIDNAILQTQKNTGMILNFALNYGSRAEILSAVNQLLTLPNSEPITEEIFSKHLMTASLSPYEDPELVIRTSGEQRISNFLLWQMAYSELYFSKTYWPEFSQEELFQALIDYQTRQRRFGGLST